MFLVYFVARRPQNSKPGNSPKVIPINLQHSLNSNCFWTAVFAISNLGNLAPSSRNPALPRNRIPKVNLLHALTLLSSSRDHRMLILQRSSLHCARYSSRNQLISDINSLPERTFATIAWGHIDVVNVAPSNDADDVKISITRFCTVTVPPPVLQLSIWS